MAKKSCKSSYLRGWNHRMFTFLLEIWRSDYRICRFQLWMTVSFKSRSLILHQMWVPHFPESGFSYIEVKISTFPTLKKSFVAKYLCRGMAVMIRDSSESIAGLLIPLMIYVVKFIFVGESRSSRFFALTSRRLFWLAVNEILINVVTEQWLHLSVN